MKKYRMTLPVALLTLGLLIPNVYAGGRGPGKTVFQFLTVGTDARAAVLGGAFTSRPGNSNAIFYNPANLARLQLPFNFSASRNRGIADINYFSGSFAFDPDAIGIKIPGVLALSFIYVDYGEFLGTKFDATTGKGYVDTGTFSPSAYTFGIGYARYLNDRLSVGGHVKYVWQSFDVNAVENSFALAYDIGIYFKLPLKNLNLAMAMHNKSFLQSKEFETDGCGLPLNFTTGLSMNVSDLLRGKPMKREEEQEPEQQRVSRQQSDSLQQSAPQQQSMPEQQNVSKTHNLLASANVSFPSSFSKQIHVGGEYYYDNLVALRLGYKYNIKETIQTGQNAESGLTFGFSLRPEIGGKKVDFDYAWTPLDVLNDAHRLSLSFSF